MFSDSCTFHISCDNLTLASWYHSHVGFTLLSAHGALILHQADNSPVDSNCPIPYDEERVFIVEDFFYLDEEALVAEAAKGQFVGAANVCHSSHFLTIPNMYLTGQIRLINGQNYATCNQTVLTQFNDTNTCDNKCSYAAFDLEPDKTYLFRFIGATIDTFSGIAIEDHNLTIVQVDGGSWIEPYDTNYIEMHSGQRYACILKAKTQEELEKSGQLTYVIPLLSPYFWGMC
jgi:FtsP/CotA-like multicopper oxidase with cupredoxin domain